MPKITTGSAFDRSGYVPKIDWAPVSADCKRATAASTAVAQGKVSIGVESVTAKRTRRIKQAELNTCRKGR